MFKKLFIKFKNHGLTNIIPDRMYLNIYYQIRTGRKLNLKEPQTFNEKLQWLKLYNRKNEYTTMVDKALVKEYVAKRIGKEHIIPTIGIWDKFDDIDFEKLPQRFVIKCTHDSGGLIICKDKSTFDIDKAKQKINDRLKYKYYYHSREWPYKNVKPKIIIEQYMEDESGYELKDYKIFCFNGEPKFIMVDSDRFIDHKRNVYNTKWEKLDLNINFPSTTVNYPKPKCLNEMLEFSKKLSKHIPFIRTDFYIINNKVYFGELTFYPGSGFQKIEPDEWNYKLGEMIDLSKMQ